MSPCVTRPVNESEYLQNTYIIFSLTYGPEVWSTSKDALNKLEIVQKRVPKWISPTPIYDEGLQCFNLLHMFVYKDLCLLNSILTGNCDFPFFNNITLSIEKREGLRSATDIFFDVRKTLKTKTNEDFLIRSCLAANKLHKNTDITVFLWTKSVQS